MASLVLGTVLSISGEPGAPSGADEPIGSSGSSGSSGTPVRVHRQPVPRKERRVDRREARKRRDFSEGGTARGTLEFALAGVTQAGTIALIGRGIWELTRDRRIEARCQAAAMRSTQCIESNRVLDRRDARIAAGLSFGVAVPMAVASGLLLARALRIRRDYRAYHGALAAGSLQVVPWGGPTGGGFEARLRF